MLKNNLKLFNTKYSFFCWENITFVVGMTAKDVDGQQRYRTWLNFNHLIFLAQNICIIHYYLLPLHSRKGD
jgi:hypothetical protein